MVLLSVGVLLGRHEKNMTKLGSMSCLFLSLSFPYMTDMLNAV